MLWMVDRMVAEYIVVGRRGIVTVKYSVCKKIDVWIVNCAWLGMKIIVRKRGV